MSRRTKTRLTDLLRGWTFTNRETCFARTDGWENAPRALLAWNRGDETSFRGKGSPTPAVRALSGLFQRTKRS
ncbi:MAG: hypothetical protein ACTS4U_01590 [Candidatus Hodgkinia cicadicola]